MTLAVVWHHDTRKIKNLTNSEEIVGVIEMQRDFYIIFQADDFLPMHKSHHWHTCCAVSVCK